ncbi:hypothetical protein LX32DRAFT_678214 [Colletotrichum zoysiae]|uniref:Protein kinase domain-containing protein n=1 Tax=Colletotrichum zoysiae TaxID=1216348 RepID=A0AAD9H2H4_9PEZI|nr:hypothetical protein LX32DRAFT_678214 [Colletotrichum zoysiae]
MEKSKHYDVALWQVHETEEDCELIIRTNNGYAFYCRIFPQHLQQSPGTTKYYFKCLNLLRSGEEQQDDFYPLIAQLLLSTPTLPDARRPTLDQYLSPQHFVCDLEVIDEVPRPYLTENQKHGWSRPVVVVKDEFIKDLDQWTQSYHPSDVQIIYHHPKDVLIKRPKKVLVDASKGSETTCFFKPFGLSLGPEHAKKELLTLRKVTEIPHAPEAWVCRLYGVVREGNMLMGMLFTWIDATGVLGRARAENSSSDMRKRWAAQISTSLEKLHDRDITWGDAKADNVLIDRDNNAWVIDFGGSYTPGWVDKEKAGTLAGDAQGLAKILDILR